MELIEVKTKDQINEVARLADKIWTQHYADIISVGQIKYMLEKFQSKEAIARQIELEGYTYYLFNIGSENAGYAGIVKKGDRLYVSKLYVEKSLRGRGIASGAVDEFLKICAREGLRAVFLNVNKKNSAIDAYKKLGFKVIQSVVEDIGQGYVVDDYIMERII